MTLRAELVVMAACETARRRIYQTEGVVGPTPAFRFARAQLAICSLRKAQEFVRGHPARPGWKSPHYRTACVFWGLPE